MDEDFPDPRCDNCMRNPGDEEGGHHPDEHDETPEQAGVPWHSLGSHFYHGTGREIEGGVLTPGASSSTINSHRMIGRASSSHGTYVYTGFEGAMHYAHGDGATIHEVVPHPDDHGPYDYELDPAGGPNGDDWNVPTIRDAAELASYGDEGGDGVALRFPGRMISKRQFRISHGERP